MSPLLIGALVGAGLGALKSERGRAQAKRDQLLAAQLMQTTPYGNVWKNLADQYALRGMSSPDDLTAIAEGGLGGASMGQMFQQNQMDIDRYENEMNLYDKLAEYAELKKSGLIK